MSSEPNCAKPANYNEGWVFYGPDWTTPASHQFTVGDKPIILTAVGLGLHQCVCIEQVFGCAAGDEFVALGDGCGGCVLMNECSSNVILSLSGRYRLVYTDNNVLPALIDPSTITVYGRPQLVPNSYGGHEMACCTSPDPNSHVPASISTTDGTVTAAASGTNNQTFALSFNPVNAAAAIAGNAGAQTILAAALCDDLGPCINTRVTALLPTSLPPSGPAGGALTGTYPNPGINPASVLALAAVVLTDAFNVRIGAIFP